MMGCTCALFAGLLTVKNLKQVVTGSMCRSLYIQMRILTTNVEYLANFMTFWMILIGHFGTILTIWLVIKSGMYLDFSVKFGLLFITLTFVIVAIIYIPAGASVPEMTAELIQSKLDRLYCRNLRNKWKYHPYSLWKAQRIIYVKFGQFFPIKKSVTGRYFQEIINNLVNAIILIDPN